MSLPVRVGTSFSWARRFRKESTVGRRVLRSYSFESCVEGHAYLLSVLVRLGRTGDCGGLLEASIQGLSSGCLGVDRRGGSGQRCRLREASRSDLGLKIRQDAPRVGFGAGEQQDVRPVDRRPKNSMPVLRKDRPDADRHQVRQVTRVPSAEQIQSPFFMSREDRRRALVGVVVV